MSSVSLSIPATPDEVASALDEWEEQHGAPALYDALVREHGQEDADRLWEKGLEVYDEMHREDEDDAV